MTEPIVFVSRNRIKEGKADEFGNHYRDSVPAILLSKTGTLTQLAYENDEATEVTIIRMFPNADALDLQIQGADWTIEDGTHIHRIRQHRDSWYAQCFYCRKDTEESGIGCLREDQP